MQRMVLSLVFGAIFIAVSGSAAAEEKEDLVEVSEGQLDLNDRGVDSIAEGEYERAIRLFEASLDLGRLNVTYTNLGRAYQRAGMCQNAEEAYRAALSDSPRAKEPTPEQIERAIESYRAEMEEACPGHLHVECTPAEIRLFVDDQGPKECTDEMIFDLMPGAHEVRGELEGYEVTYRVTIEALQVESVHLDLSHVEVEEEVVEELQAQEEPQQVVAQDFDAQAASVEPPSPPESSSSVGWILLAGGSMSLAGGVALDTIPASASNGQVDPINFVPVGLYVASFGLAWMGIRKLLR